MPASWSNTSHQLNINPNHTKTLIVKSAHSCTGIASGQKNVFFAASFKFLGTRANQTITDP